MKITVGQFIKFINVLRQPCCYTNVKRKKWYERFWDNVKWYINDGRVNEEYNLYGLDIINSNQKNYLSYKDRSKDRKRILDEYDYRNLLKYLDNKYYFYRFCTKNNLPHPEVLAYYENGYEKLKYKIHLDEILLSGPIFCKQTVGCGGHEVKCIRNLMELESLKKEWKTKAYIIQKMVKNNEKIAQIYSNSLNTIRLVIVSNGERVGFFSAVLRCGTKDSGNVDNLSEGGFAIGISSKGKLMKYGHYDRPYNKKIVAHPDTGVVFEGILVPYFNEAINLGINAHKCIKEVPAIGWDIAVTEHGAVLIEGNYDWGIDLMQMCHGGLKSKWKDLVKI